MRLGDLASLARIYVAPLAQPRTWRSLLMAIPTCLFLHRHQLQIEDRFFDPTTNRDRFQFNRTNAWYRIGTRGPVFCMLFASTSYLWAPPIYQRTALAVIVTAGVADITKRALKALLPDSNLTRRPPAQDYPRGGHSGMPSGHALISAYLVVLYYPHGAWITTPLSALAFIGVVPSLLCNCHTAAQIAAGLALGIFFGNLGQRFASAIGPAQLQS